MKKILAVMVAASVAGVACADLAISFKSGNVVSSLTAGYDGAVSGNLVQLIWSSSSSALGAGGYDVGAGKALQGEYVLAELNGGSYGFFGPQSVGPLANDVVGGADINSGYFFARIFQDGDVGSGDYFFDTAKVDASGYIFDATVPATTFSANISGLATGAVIDVTSNGTTVIPEPATFGLMGVAGLGLFLARKKARR